MRLPLPLLGATGGVALGLMGGGGGAGSSLAESGTVESGGQRGTRDDREGTRA